MKKFLLITSLLSTVLSAHICDSINCSKLADSLIATDSRGWYWNRYDRGSASLVKKYPERNGQEKFKVSFTFNGGRQGWAKIVLTRDGDFVCITYFNYPNTCRELRGSYKKNVQSNTKNGSEKSVSVESNCYNNTCTVKVNGSYYNGITYKYNSSGVYEGCYTFYNLGFAFYYCPNYFDSNSKLNGSCGKTSAYSLHNAMEKIANCKVNGHY